VKFTFPTMLVGWEFQNFDGKACVVCVVCVDCGIEKRPGCSGCRWEAVSFLPVPRWGADLGQVFGGFLPPTAADMRLLREQVHPMGQLWFLWKEAHPYPRHLSHKPIICVKIPQNVVSLFSHKVFVQPAELGLSSSLEGATTQKFRGNDLKWKKVIDISITEAMSRALLEFEEFEEFGR